ncbi:MAG: type IV secretory system conjugative DNA transfer family protein [Lachnospiraceae bacterium]|nr:type IV secretory system conjugative DNA transfer family protein [Lachnospiraceae bacterium]
MSDLSCLAEGLVVPADFEKTGLNLNELVVGPAGCGKSYSNAYSRLVHTFDSSVVVPVAKKAIREKFAKMFKKRGYEVINLDFVHPDKCEIGYDPLDYIHSDEDVIHLARNLVYGYEQKENNNIDPYWNESAVSVLAAEIMLVMIRAKDKRSKACFGDVVELHRSIRYDTRTSLLTTNIDIYFHEAESRHPGNQASEMWKTATGLSPKTASCIFSIVNGAMDKIFTDSILVMTMKKNRISFKELGKKKTALFITTSPINKALQNYVNILYADMFRELFETAEAAKDGRLKIPVHIICDDFACGSKIVDFEDYISIFRAAGISVTMLLQSESQLTSMYGEYAAITIINNCDTYVYMGGMDIRTCHSISERMNKPVNKVMSMPLEQVVVFRRGNEPYVSRRYQILDDPVYKQVMAEDVENDADGR